MLRLLEECPLCARHTTIEVDSVVFGEVVVNGHLIFVFCAYNLKMSVCMYVVTIKLSIFSDVQFSSVGII